MGAFIYDTNGVAAPTAALACAIAAGSPTPLLGSASGRLSDSLLLKCRGVDHAAPRKRGDELTGLQTIGGFRHPWPADGPNWGLQQLGSSCCGNAIQTVVLPPPARSAGSPIRPCY